MRPLRRGVLRGGETVTARELLRLMTAQAYNGDEMSLLCGVFARKWVPPDNLVPDPERNLTAGDAKKRAPGWDQSILDLLRHVAECKAMYMEQAFGAPSEPFGALGDGLRSLLEYLDATQKYLVSCLDKMPDEDLAKPVATQCHGESAANLFWVLAQHDIHHGSQIKLLRRLARE